MGKYSLDSEIEKAKKEKGILKSSKPKSELKPKPPNTNIAMLFFQWF